MFPYILLSLLIRKLKVHVLSLDILLIDGVSPSKSSYLGFCPFKDQQIQRQSTLRIIPILFYYITFVFLL